MQGEILKMLFKKKRISENGISAVFSHTNQKFNMLKTTQSQPNYTQL
jgi:hypothetical protein